MTEPKSQEYQMSNKTFYSRMFIFVLCVMVVINIVFAWEALPGSKNSRSEKEIIVPAQLDGSESYQPQK